MQKKSLDNIWFWGSHNHNTPKKCPQKESAARAPVLLEKRVLATPWKIDGNFSLKQVASRKRQVASGRRHL